MKTLIIEIKKGGLGDHLFYSHLPRIAKETKAFDRVLISNRSYYRNNDYKKLVWELNPFIDGFTDKQGLFYEPEQADAHENLLDKIMLLYGMDDGQRWHEPEIYFKPAYEKKYEGLNIYDPNFISYTGDFKKGATIESWLQSNHLHLDAQMKTLGQKTILLHCTQTIETANLFEFCSLLISCNRMFCLTTGTATLAAALHVPVTVFYGNGHLAKYRHSKLHQYVPLGTDYSFLQKIKKQLVLLRDWLIPAGKR